MKPTVRRLGEFVTRHNNKLLLAGLATAGWHNYRLWRRDRSFLQGKAQPTVTPPQATWSRRPKVSVLVAAWNEAENIERHIRSFRALRYPNKELVLCAGGKDGTYRLAARLAGDGVVVLEQQPGEGKQRALRRCLDAAQGTVVFLTDADCLLDDESFERTVHPIAVEQERACTGGSRPYPELLSVPFVVAQAAPDLYSTLHRPLYAPGLLGRNSAIDRNLVEACRGLDAPAPTGTDFVLAKLITQAGVPIRQIPESRVATEYPQSVKGYIRQQRRWIRNVTVHGRRFGASDEVRASLFTSAVGAGMLLLPLSSLVLGRASLHLWLVLFAHTLLSRLRYLQFAASVLGFGNTWPQVAVQLPVILISYLAWSRPLLDYAVPSGDKVW